MENIIKQLFGFNRNKKIFKKEIKIVMDNLRDFDDSNYCEDINYYDLIIKFVSKMLKIKIEDELLNWEIKSLWKAILEMKSEENGEELTMILFKNMMLNWINEYRRYWREEN